MPITFLTPEEEFDPPESMARLSSAPSSLPENVPFISTQDIVDYLGRGGTADPGMIIAADAACDICRTVAEQSFSQSVSTITLDGTGTDALLLPELPVNSAGTVVVAGGTVTDYMLNSNGILFRGTAGIDPRPVWPRGRQNVTITYDHGYAEVDIPRDVRVVALSVASRLVVQGVAVEEQLGSARIKYAGAATDLTAGEQLILSKYRQHR
jgi:hypothetical protein